MQNEDENPSQLLLRPLMKFGGILQKKL